MTEDEFLAFLSLFLGIGDKWSNKQLFLDAFHPIEGKESIFILQLKLS